jgi:alkylresorcinol/alkylpyrone synthase
MHILTTSTAYPPHYYSQREVVDALLAFWGNDPQIAAVLERLHMRTGVDGRHFSRRLDEYRDLDTWGKVNDVWIQVAEELGERVLHCTLKHAGLQPEDLGAIFFVTVTGVASPSIDARLVNRMGLNRNIRRNPIFGLGCVAGAAGLARAADYVRAHPDQVAALLSVELCSLTWQREDLSAANLISSALFGDGAAAVIVSGAELNTKGPRVVATCSSFYPGTENVMGWHISEKGFRIVLSPAVPEMVYQHLSGDVDRFLAAHGLVKNDIHSWIMHTGGPKVLTATAEVLGLAPGALDVSWEVLREVGNLSSASVLVVLERYMSERRPPKASHSILAAMGPGFCAELVLLQW